jgi:hypothetical protein
LVAPISFFNCARLVALAMGAVTVRRAISHAKGDLHRPCTKSPRNLTQRVENPEAAVVQVFFHEIASCLVRNVGRRPVFACQKSTS